MRPLRGARTVLRSLVCTGLEGAVGATVDPARTLVINGFWRSGTTWVQEIAAEMMGAKMVFEPLQARAEAIFGCLDEIRPQRRDYPFINALMPYLQIFPEKGKLHDLILRSLRGQYRSPHVRRGCPCLQESARKRVVTKFTRATLCLVAMSQHFHGPVIHVRRDPRAAIASIKRGGVTNWGEGAFTDFDLATHLLGVDDGRRDYFMRWEREILQLQQQDDIARLAGYYCLTEKYLNEQVALANPSRFACIQYEDLLPGGPEKFRLLLEGLGVRTVPIPPERFQKKSSTAYSTCDTSHRGSGLGRSVAWWKTSLTPAEQTAIEDAAVLLGMEDRLVEVVTPCHG